MSDDLSPRLPPGPILVVADNGAIARRGLSWAAAWLQEGRVYRVRLAGPSSVAAIAVEAKALGAAVILWVGAADVCELASLAARDVGIPLVGEDVLPSPRE